MPPRRSDEEIREEMNNPNTSEDRRRRLRYELSRRRRVENALDATGRYLPQIDRQNARRRRQETPQQDMSDIQRRMRNLGITGLAGLSGSTITTPAGIVEIPYYTPQPGEQVDIVPGVYTSPTRVVETELEEDTDDYVAKEASKSSLSDEFIKSNEDANCKGEWMVRNCISCQNPITLEAFEADSADSADSADLISIKIYNDATEKFGKGQCMIKSDLKEMISSGQGTVFSIWKGGDTSGRGGKPTDKIVVKLHIGAVSIYITIASAHKLFHNKDKIFYALPLYGGKRRRVGNLYGRIGVSENHGQIPGFKIYKLFTRDEVEMEATGYVIKKQDYSLNFLVSEKMEELYSMFMDTTQVREFLLKKIVEYITE
jgi:hypothetical protein